MKAYLKFVLGWMKFKKLSQGCPTRFALDWQDKYPCLDDNLATADFDRHYIYHPAWAARILAGNHPALHIDISSTLHFCSLLSAFMPVQFYDYRLPDLALDNLHCRRADLMALPFADGSIVSLSCMHVIEHIGLGRYGDPLDPDGDLKAMKELQRVLAPGGTLLLVVPLAGTPRIRFNAHRLYSYRQITGGFADLKLQEFALVPDKPEHGGLIRDASPETADAQNYGCGCFHFTK